MIDTMNLEDILNDLDAHIQYGADLDSVEMTVSDLRAIRRAFGDAIDTMAALRTTKPPRFIEGDLARDVTNGREFKIRGMNILSGDNGEFSWHYTSGFYFLPESDLELVRREGYAEEILGDQKG